VTGTSLKRIIAIHFGWLKEYVNFGDLELIADFRTHQIKQGHHHASHPQTGFQQFPQATVDDGRS
jgi:hypothetical protein